MLCALFPWHSSFQFSKLRALRSQPFPVVGTAKVEGFFESAKFILKYFLKLFFEVEISCLLAADISLFPSRCHGRFGRPSLAEWCKDRDKIPILPRPANEYF